MMADINNLVSESVLDFMMRTYQGFVPSHKKNEVPAVFLTVLQHIYDKYIQAAKRITAVPHHKLITEHEVVYQHKAKRIDNVSKKWLMKHPEHMIKTAEGIAAAKILTAKKKITYDTQENRLVKFILKSTISRIDDFHRRYLKSTITPDAAILENIMGMKGELKRLLSSSFLNEVSEYSASQSMSLVFGMAPGYRELYKYYIMLQNGISVGGDIFHMSVKETAQLYEYWCFIKLYSILKERYTLKSPDIIKVDRRGVTVDLVKGKASTIEFYNARTDERFYLAYNPSESKTQTVNQRPDNVLELEKKGSKTAYKYIFDAKYRIEQNPESGFYPDTKPGPKVDDINTMHRYRDSIVYENKESRFTFEKTMFGAYILFPYSNEEEYANHRFYKSIDTVNIGGLPFLPSATNLVTQLLDTLITDTSESAFERTTLPIGIENRIKGVDWSRRDVLIGMVENEAELQTYLKKKMYFTDGFSRDHLPIHYVALYEKGKGIRYYGDLINWRIENNTQLPGKRKKKGKSHVFEVLGWKQLPEMITKEEVAPSPIAYTNHFLLMNSRTYSELRLRNEAEYRLFMELRRRADASIREQGSEIAFEVWDAKVKVDRDTIAVIGDGRTTATCTVDEFNRRPNASFRRLMRYVEKLGD